jgi:hypothetical protein
MLMRFFHAHAVFFYANVRGLRERTELRRRFAEHGVY